MPYVEELFEQKHYSIHPFRVSLLLLSRRTRFKESLSHLSVALPAGVVLPDGFFAQPIEMRVHSWNPSFTPYSQSFAAR